MTDEPELPLAGLDAERPLPPELGARLEAALLGAVAGGLPIPADAWGLHQPGTRTESLDAPRPLPGPLLARLEEALLGEAAAMPAHAPAAEGPAAAAATTGGTPAATPEGTAAVVRLEGRRRKVVAAWSAVAAVLLMVVAVAGLAGRGGDPGSGNVEVAGGPTTTTAEPPAPLPSGAGDSSEVTAPPPAPASTTTRAPRPPRPSPSTTAPRPAPTSTQPPASPTTQPPLSQPGGGESQPAPAGQGDTGPPPPFYDSAAPGDPSAISTQPSPSSPAPGAGAGGSQDAAPPGQTQKSGTPAAAGPPLRVGVVAGDDRQMAGFGAYVSRLNQSGGVRGHSIELVTVGPGSPRTDTIATVNLSPQPVAGPGGAPGWVTGPLLETLAATEAVLPGDGTVFSFASPPERQGHLAADALFPSAVTGKTAVIYAGPAGSGAFHDAVPAAMRAVLEQRGVKVRVVEYDPNQRPARLLPANEADAALLSLDPAAARAWVADAKAAGYRPASGVAGIYSLADEALLPDLPEGARVVSPYAAPGGDEVQAIRSGAGGTSASVLHGWATAKSLAAAIWRTGADTPAELRAALEGLAGWSSGLTPRYETRPDSRARTPEGVVFRVQAQAFVADGGFRRDPY